MHTHIRSYTIIISHFRAEGIYEDFGQFQATVRADGSIRWEPGGVFKTMCAIDITYYPFDEQRCDLTFGAWSYYTSKMNLTTDVTTINLDTYETNGEWEIYGTRVKRNEFHFEVIAFFPARRRLHIRPFRKKITSHGLSSLKTVGK